MFILKIHKKEAQYMLVLNIVDQIRPEMFSYPFILFLARFQSGY